MRLAVVCEHGKQVVLAVASQGVLDGLWERLGDPWRLAIEPRPPRTWQYASGARGWLHDSIAEAGGLVGSLEPMWKAA